MYALAYEGLKVFSPWGRGQASPEASLDAMRRKALESAPAPRLGLEGEWTASKLLESARSLERWRFNRPIPNQDPPIPGWAPSEVPPRSETELFGQDPVVARRAAAIVSIHASALRRSIDHDVTRALMLLGAMTKDPSADATQQRGADSLRSLLAHMSVRQKQEAHQNFKRASGWLAQEFRNEGEKLDTVLRSYGKERLQEFTRSCDWPSNLRVQVQDEHWPGILAGYGDDVVFGLVRTLKQAFKGSQQSLAVHFIFFPMPGPVNVRPTSRNAYLVEFRPPDGKKPGRTVLAEILRDLSSYLAPQGR